MSSLSSNRIISIYKSRNVILEILKSQGYDVSGYAEFSINEIDMMSTNDQLDMLIHRETDDSNVYVKYVLAVKQMRKEILDELIDDLFNIENVLTKKDSLIVIVNEESNETIINKIKYLYNHDGIFIVAHNIKRLQFNILNHSLVPNISILNKEEINELTKKFNLKSLQQLPEISRFDPQALAVCLRPGQVCKLERKSVTALKYDYYRVCI